MPSKIGSFACKLEILKIKNAHADGGAISIFTLMKPPIQWVRFCNGLRRMISPSTKPFRRQRSLMIRFSKLQECGTRPIRNILLFLQGYANSSPGFGRRIKKGVIGLRLGRRKSSSRPSFLFHYFFSELLCTQLSTGDDLWGTHKGEILLGYNKECAGTFGLKAEVCSALIKHQFSM